MKVIDKGWAKPDSPIYRRDLVIGGRFLTLKSKKPSEQKKDPEKPESESSSTEEKSKDGCSRVEASTLPG